MYKLIKQYFINKNILKYLKKVLTYVGLFDIIYKRYLSRRENLKKIF